MHGAPDVLSAVPAAAALVRAAARAGLSLEQTCLVGGAVRDALLDRPVLDLDLAHEGDGVHFAEQLAAALGGEVLATHSFGTATVSLPLEGATVLVDIASARTEEYERPGALPTVSLGATLSEDLRRRDFTINALAARLSSAEPGALLGVTGVGQRPGIPFDADLRSATIRVLHDRSFLDDPTRILRALRYAARLDFALEPLTGALAEEALAADALATVSRERLATELELLCRERCTRTLGLLEAHGVFRALGPALLTDLTRRRELMALVDREWGDTPERQSLAWHMRLALMVAPLGHVPARQWLQAMAFSARDVAAAAGYIELLELVVAHDRRIASASPAELLDLVRTDDPLALAFASLMAGPEAGAALERYAAAVKSTTLAVGGHELLELGLAPGPAVGRVLDALYRRKLLGEIPDDDAERAAAELLVAEVRGTDGR